MKKLLFFILGLFMATVIVVPQNNFPIVGVSDERVEIYGLKGATVVVDYNQTITDADILIVNGRIKAVGKDRVLGVLMPEKESNPESVEMALTLANGGVVAMRKPVSRGHGFTNPKVR